jgi:hypothetical protein
MNLYLHPRVEVIIMMMNFAVLTVQTLTFLRAFLASAVALAVVFLALRFLASAATHRHEGRNALESPRVSEVGHLLSLVYLECAVGLVAATDA